MPQADLKFQELKADVTQSVECDPSKFEAVGSSPIIRYSNNSAFLLSYLTKTKIFFLSQRLISLKDEIKPFKKKKI